MNRHAHPSERELSTALDGPVSRHLKAGCPCHCFSSSKSSTSTATTDSRAVVSESGQAVTGSNNTVLRDNAQLVSGNENTVVGAGGVYLGPGASLTSNAEALANRFTDALVAVNQAAGQVLSTTLAEQAKLTDKAIKQIASTEEAKTVGWSQNTITTAVVVAGAAAAFYFWNRKQ